MNQFSVALFAGWGLALAVGCLAITPEPSRAGLERIQASADGAYFVGSDSGQPFVAWGFNYDHDATGRLIEDYWDDEWSAVVQDFQEMRDLGANTVRIHLQLGRFMKTPDSPNQEALEQLARLITLAETSGLYLDLTGLGCYHKRDVPSWYGALSERERWDAQAHFWRAVARVGRDRPAVFCYDLMNEPIVPGGDEPATEWLTGELGGKHFAQRIALDPAGRTQHQIAKAWLDLLVQAIRTQDSEAMITVGVIPWAFVFPGARPLFYSAEVAGGLDFVSVHCYPKTGEVDRALEALAVYDVGKPLVIEEWFPLHCSTAELGEFLEGSRMRADGWLGFYWGTPSTEYAAEESPAAALTKAWLDFFQTHTLANPNSPRTTLKP